MSDMIFPVLEIPETLAAGPGPGNTDARVLAAFARAGVADHMQADVLRGMIECKHMLRSLWGTKNIHTYGVAGTGFSGLDCMLNAILPGDTVVAFTNGTFSGIDCLTIRMKAATREELTANPMDPNRLGHHRDRAARPVGRRRHHRKDLGREETEMGLHGALGNRLGPHQ